MVDDWVIKTMYATKRRRRTVKSIKAPVKDPPKSNPSKRHRERLNSELDHLASLLPFEQSVISKLDKLSILRLGVSFLKTKSYFQNALPERYGMDSHLLNRSHFFHEPGFSEGEGILQALYGFLFVVTCEGEVFYASRTVEQYLGFHQSDIIHQSVMELIHSEDREEFKKQLTWNSASPQDRSNLQLQDLMMPENTKFLQRSFTVRFRCLLDNTSGFITLEINGRIQVLHGQSPRGDEPNLALFATCSPFGPMSLLDLPSRDLTFKSKHKMDFSPISFDSRGKIMFGYDDSELSAKSGYDLIHPEDLNYFSQAHHEPYRWLTQDFRWIWQQSSCKVIYKNSKPDFIICTHRQLTDDEGQDLFRKRGSEFKLPYPLLDLDVNNFGFPEDDFFKQSKTGKNKKQKSENTGKDYYQNNKKRKNSKDILSCFNGNAYVHVNNVDSGDYKADLLCPYPSGNCLDVDVYRPPHGFSSWQSPVFPPPADAYRLEQEKSEYLNSYYLDHRQYQHPLRYHNNGYTDLLGTPKYGFDVPYSLDITKKYAHTDDIPRVDDFRRYGYDCSDRVLSRINGVEDLTRSSAFTTAPVINSVDPPQVAMQPSYFKQDALNILNEGSCSSEKAIHSSNGDAITSTHNSVIKCTNTLSNTNCGRGSNSNSQCPVQDGHVIGSEMNWSGSLRAPSETNPSPVSEMHSPVCSGKLVDSEGHDGQSPTHDRLSNGYNNSPTSIETSVIQGTEKNANRYTERQEYVSGIPVPVVKSTPWVHQTQHKTSSWLHQSQLCPNTYADLRDWSNSDLYGTSPKLQRNHISDNFAQFKLPLLQTLP